MVGAPLAVVADRWERTELAFVLKTTLAAHGYGHRQQGGDS